VLLIGESVVRNALALSEGRHTKFVTNREMAESAPAGKSCCCQDGLGVAPSLPERW